DRLTSDPTGHAPHKLLAAGHDSQIWATVLHGGAERLPFRNHNVSPIVARPLKQTETDWIDSHGDHCAPLMSDFHECAHILKAAEEVRMLQEDASCVVGNCGSQLVRIDGSAGRADSDDLGIEVGEVGLKNLPVFRMHAGGSDDATVALVDMHAHQ